MNYGDLLQRAWRITWENKFMWLLGVLLVLGGTSYNYRTDYNTSSNTGSTPPGFPDFATFQEAFANALPIIIAVICFLLVIKLVFWLLSLVARGGLINATIQIEQGSAYTLGEAWSAGRPTFLPMLGISVIHYLPATILSLVMFGVLLIAVTGGALAATSAQDYQTMMASLGSAMLCIIALCCLTLLITIPLSILRPFADRACVLEDKTGIAAFRHGWDVFRDNLGDGVVLGLIRIVVTFIVRLAFSLTIAAIFIALLLGGVAAGLGLDQAGASPENLLGPAAIALCCFLLVAIVVGLGIMGVMEAYFSNMWTLAYREFMQKTNAQLDAPPAV